jgi:riboflavin kinase/FMN adenylyltransferase
MEVYNLHKMKPEEGSGSPLLADSSDFFVSSMQTVVALGSFDGIHEGHTALILRAVDYAKKHGIKSVVWTFSNDASELPGKKGVRILTTLEEKLSLIASLGVDFVVLENFSRVADYTPEKFVKEILICGCGAVCTICGFNFRFGKNGMGNCDTLRELMYPRDCIVVPPVYKGGRLVSSSAIRLLIEAGEVEEAAILLGRPFSIKFLVVHGKQLGRKIGIPTINQNFPDGHIIPKNGIYACTVEIGIDIFLGVSNVGVRPTVEDGTCGVNCETHIINYNGWLYGKEIKVSFYKRLRDEIKFSNVDSLKVQINRDIDAAIDYFSKK